MRLPWQYWLMIICVIVCKCVEGTVMKWFASNEWSSHSLVIRLIGPLFSTTFHVSILVFRPVMALLALLIMVCVIEDFQRYKRVYDVANPG